MARPRFTFTTQQHQAEGLFEIDGGTPATGTPESLPWGEINSAALENWAEIKGRCIPALHASPTTGCEQFREEFIRGAQLLGLDSERKPLHPQQLVIADMLNATDEFGLPLHSTVGTEIPRRATKTTSIMAVLLGRCLAREEYMVGFSAQSGIKTRERFMKDIVAPLNRLWRDPERRPFKIVLSRGEERIVFENGSTFACLPPQAESYRGDAYDVVWLDEAQEHDPELSEELSGAIEPTFDTRPNAQLIVSGTTGKIRAGIFWSTLEAGRNGTDGILEFAVPDGLTPDDLMTDGHKDWAKAKPYVLASHPGAGNLTPIARLEKNFIKLPLAQFMREYLGIWPEDLSQGAIDQADYRACAIEFQTRPEHFVLAFDVEPSGASAAIVAVWRDETFAYAEILENKPGVNWLGAELVRLAQKYRCLIAYDAIGAAQVEADALTRKRPRPRLRPISYQDVAPATAALRKEFKRRTFRHFDQQPLNDAVSKVALRPLGDGNFGWRRKGAEGDITPLIAITTGLRVYDANQKRSGSRMVTATSLQKKVA